MALNDPAATASRSADLIDEFRLWIFPLLIGTAKRLFGDGTIPAGLKLVKSKLSTTGAPGKGSLAEAGAAS